MNIKYVGTYVREGGMGLSWERSDFHKGTIFWSEGREGRTSWWDVGVLTVFILLSIKSGNGM